MTHARREQLAREKGFASYRQYRQASQEQRRAASAQLAARSPAYRRAAGHQLARDAIGGRRQVFPTPAGTIVSSTRNGVFLSQLRQAADRDEVVRARVVYRDARGTQRDAELWDRGGYSADQLHHRITTEFRTGRSSSSPFSGDKSGGDVAAAIAQFVSAVYGAGDVEPDGIVSLQLTASPT